MAAGGREPLALAATVESDSADSVPPRSDCPGPRANLSGPRAVQTSKGFCPSAESLGMAKTAPPRFARARPSRGVFVRPGRLDYGGRFREFFGCNWQAIGYDSLLSEEIPDSWF